MTELFEVAANMGAGKNILATANAHFRAAEYLKALELYQQAGRTYGAEVVSANIDVCLARLQPGDAQRTGICNSITRASMGNESEEVGPEEEDSLRSEYAGLVERYEQQLAYHRSELERFAHDKHEELIQWRQKLAKTEKKLAYYTSEMEKFALDKQENVVTFRQKLGFMESQTQRLSSLVSVLLCEREQLQAKVATLRTSWLSWFAFPVCWLYHSFRKVRQVFRGRSYRSEIRVIEESALFDAVWYALEYPDVIECGANPAEHYARYGAFEGRDPGPSFSSAKYLKRNRDLAGSGINPLVHYELHGKHEGRSPR